MPATESAVAIQVARDPLKKVAPADPGRHDKNSLHFTIIYIAKQGSPLKAIGNHCADYSPDSQFPVNFTVIRRLKHFHLRPPVPPTHHRRVDPCRDATEGRPALPAITSNEVIDVHYPAFPRRSLVRPGPRPPVLGARHAGKAASAILGLLIILCACSLILGAARGAGEAVGLLPTRTPAPAPTAQALATPPPTIAPATRAPTQPTMTSAPALALPAGTQACPAPWSRA